MRPKSADVKMGAQKNEAVPVQVIQDNYASNSFVLTDLTSRGSSSPTVSAIRSPSIFRIEREYGMYEDDLETATR